jgi:hypothetical protein
MLDDGARTFAPGGSWLDSSARICVTYVCSDSRPTWSPLHAVERTAEEAAAGINRRIPLFFATLRMSAHTDDRATHHMAIPVRIIDQTAVVDKSAPCAGGDRRHPAPQ